MTSDQSPKTGTVERSAGRDCSGTLLQVATRFCLTGGATGISLRTGITKPGADKTGRAESPAAGLKSQKINCKSPAIVFES